MVGNKIRMKGYRNGDKWITRSFHNSEEVKREGININPRLSGVDWSLSPPLGGDKVCRQMYVDILDENIHSSQRELSLSPPLGGDNEVVTVFCR